MYIIFFNNDVVDNYHNDLAHIFFLEIFVVVIFWEMMIFEGMAILKWNESVSMVKEIFLMVIFLMVIFLIFEEILSYEVIFLVNILVIWDSLEIVEMILIFLVVI